MSHPKKKKKDDFRGGDRRFDQNTELAVRPKAVNRTISTGFSMEGVLLTFVLISFTSISSSSSSQSTYQSDFQLYATNDINNSNQPPATGNLSGGHNSAQDQREMAGEISQMSCTNGLLTFELSTGFIYKPASAETLAMMPSTLQLTDCLDYCLHNASCLAINFEMGLCVLLSSSAKQNPTNLYSSQFPVFTIYAEKKCLLSGDSQASKQRRRCQRAWTFERVAGYEMKTRPRRRLKVATKEHCMEACLGERDFECRSANWYRQTGECTLSDQDRHSVSQSEAGDQQIKASLHDLYGPSNLTAPNTMRTPLNRPTLAPGLYQNYYAGLQDTARLRATSGQSLSALTNFSGSSNSLLPESDLLEETAMSVGAKRVSRSSKSTLSNSTSGLQQDAAAGVGLNSNSSSSSKYRHIRQLFSDLHRMRFNAFQQRPNDHPTDGQSTTMLMMAARQDWPSAVAGQSAAQQYVDMPANALVDYLENNCVYEPNKLCEFRKIQNRVLKTVDSIYQDIGSLEECKHKCLNAPYRCYSFDYGDTSERVCRTSHLDQASLLSVKEPYLDVVGAITYELASCFNVSIQCRAKEMVAVVSSNKMFKGKMYVKSRPNSCVNDVRESLQFELSMRYHDEACDVRASSTSQQGVFSNDIVIQHHDRIVTTQDVGLSVYCQYDLGNRSITNNVDLAIERIEEPQTMPDSKTPPGVQLSAGVPQPGGGGSGGGSGTINSPLMITSLATTVVRSPNVTMRITNMNGLPVVSATVGDRLALLFEIKEKTSPFGIFVREIIAMDGKQLLMPNNNNNNGFNSGSSGKSGGYHYATATAAANNSGNLPNENNVESIFQANKANSVLLIDSQGCPTDANIMGPLVKMDPTGQRVLAPFDAFKFPTSDMVFFRAVVTSCISECKPVMCSPNNVESSSGNKNMPTTETTLFASSTAPLPTTLIDTSPALTLTTRNLPAHPNNNNNRQSTLMNHDAMGRMSTTLSLPTARPTRPPPELQSASDNQQPAKYTTNSASYVGLTTSGATLAPTTQFPQQQQQTTQSRSSTAQEPPAQFANLTGPAAAGDYVGSTTRPRFQYTASTATQTTSATSMMPTTLAGTSGSGAGGDIATGQTGRTTSDSRHEGGDSMTTVPGFGVNREDSWPTAEETKLANSNQPNQQLQQEPILDGLLVNMTNNHYGKPPPRPTMPAQGVGSGPNGVDNRLPAPINLDALTDEQKRQIVKLFETKIKQQVSPTANNGSSSISEMADLYTGFLTSIMLNSGVNGGQNGLASADESNYKRHESATAASNHLVESSGGNNEDGSGEGIRLADFDGFLAYLIQQHQQQQHQQTGRLDSNKNDEEDKMTDVIRRVLELQQHQPKATQPLVVGIQQTSGENVGNESSPVSSAAKPAMGQQHSELAGNYSYNYNDSSNTNSNVNAPQTNEPSSSNNRIKSKQQQVAAATTTTSGNKSGANNITKPGQEAQANEKQRKKANLQALADSYLGAFQSFGRRKRRRRQADQNADGSTDDHDDLISTGYVYLEQPQWSTLAPSVVGCSNQENAKFTQGVVEMYHTNSIIDTNSNYAKHRLLKREAIAQPFYDMDELVIQSIKIVDSLQFRDDEQKQQQEANNNNNRSNKQTASKTNTTNSRWQQQQLNLPRSSLVTKSRDVNVADWTQSELSSSDKSFDTTTQDESSLALQTGGGHLVSWSSWGALGLIIVTMSFVFVQMFLVLVCLMDWNRRRARKKRQAGGYMRGGGGGPISVIDYYCSAGRPARVDTTLSGCGSTMSTLSSSSINSSNYMYAPGGDTCSPSPCLLSQRGDGSHITISSSRQSRQYFGQIAPTTIGSHLLCNNKPAAKRPATTTTTGRRGDKYHYANDYQNISGQSAAMTQVATFRTKPPVASAGPSQQQHHHLDTFMDAVMDTNRESKEDDCTTRRIASMLPAYCQTSPTTTTTTCR